MVELGVVDRLLRKVDSDDVAAVGEKLRPIAGPTSGIDDDRFSAPWQHGVGVLVSGEVRESRTRCTS